MLLQNYAANLNVSPVTIGLKYESKTPNCHARVKTRHFEAKNIKFSVKRYFDRSVLLFYSGGALINSIRS